MYRNYCFCAIYMYNVLLYLQLRTKYALLLQALKYFNTIFIKKLFLRDRNNMLGNYSNGQ